MLLAKHVTTFQKDDGMRIKRLLSGMMVGGAILALAPSPARAAQQGGRCFEGGNFLCCCSTGPSGEFIDCRCLEVIPLQPAPGPS